MDKGLTVPKWVLTVWLNIHQIPQNVLAQNVCPRQKVSDFCKKKNSLWVFVVHAFTKAKKKTFSEINHFELVKKSTVGRKKGTF